MAGGTSVMRMSNTQGRDLVNNTQNSFPPLATAQSSRGMSQTGQGAAGAATREVDVSFSLPGFVSEPQSLYAHKPCVADSGIVQACDYSCDVSLLNIYRLNYLRAFSKYGLTVFYKLNLLGNTGSQLYIIFSCATL